MLGLPAREKEGISDRGRMVQETAEQLDARLARLREQETAEDSEVWLAHKREGRRAKETAKLVEARLSGKKESTDTKPRNS